MTVVKEDLAEDKPKQTRNTKPKEDQIDSKPKKMGFVFDPKRGYVYQEIK
jgi:hypothetical protein